MKKSLLVIIFCMSLLSCNNPVEPVKTTNSQEIEQIIKSTLEEAGHDIEPEIVTAIRQRIESL